MRPFNMRSITLILLVLMSFPALAQVKREQDPFSLGSELINKNQYLKAADTMLSIRNSYYKSLKKVAGSGQPVMIDQALAFFGSLVGQEYPLNWKRSKVDQTDQRVTFKPAISYIVDAAKDKQVVMINEDHNTPKHRLLTYNLLDDFYKMGYRYLAVEAIDDDSAIVNLGYPKISSGFYMAEPNMGDMIKKAIELGFKVVPYESEDETEDDPKVPHYTQNIREVDQAKNIYQLLVKDPKAKILVHAGHGHIWERGGEVIYMAQYFKILSGIDPLTVNQSINSLNEFRSRLDVSPSLKSRDMPYVVLNSAGVPRISAADEAGSYDLLVAWPSPKTVSGRMDYQLAKKGAKRYLIQVEPADVGSLLQVKSKNPDDDISVDQFIAKKGVLEYATALDQGEYILQSTDKQGKVRWKRQIKID